MTDEADLVKLEGRLLKTGSIGAYLDKIAAIQTMIGTGNEAGARAAIASLSHVEVEAEARATLSDAYRLGLDSANELVNDPVIATATAGGKPPKTALSQIAGLDDQGATALAKAQKLSALGQDINAAASPLIGHANTLRRTATSTIVQSANAGTVAVGQAASLPLVWVAETDACVHCLAYSGQVVEAGKSFPAGLTYGAKPLSPFGKLTSPPLHPFCRCHLEVLYDPGYAEALRREADRSVLRGFSLQSESMGVRVDAADRLIKNGVDAPKSVIEYSKKSVKAGKFETRGRPADPIPPTPPQKPAPKPPKPPKSSPTSTAQKVADLKAKNAATKLENARIAAENTALKEAAAKATKLKKWQQTVAASDKKAATATKAAKPDKGPAKKAAGVFEPKTAKDAKTFGDAMGTLTEAQGETVLAYSGSAYLATNRYLRGDMKELLKGLTPERKTKLKNRIKSDVMTLDNAMKPTPRDVLVKRQLGTKAFPGGVPKVGTIYQDKAFMSTSLGGNTDTGGAGVLMHITVPKGTKAVYVGNNTHFEDERELLLSRGTELAIKTATQAKDGTWLVEATVVPRAG